MTFGDIFSEINLEIPTLNIKWSCCMFATWKEVAKIVTNQQNYLIFGRRKTLCKSKITFNSRIVDRYIEFQKYMLLFDKSNKGLGLWCLTPLSKYFSYMVAVSFIGGGVHGENHRLAVSHWQTLSDNVLSS